MTKTDERRISELKCLNLQISRNEYPFWIFDFEFVIPKGEDARDLRKKRNYINRKEERL